MTRGDVRRAVGTRTHFPSWPLGLTVALTVLAIGGASSDAGQPRGGWDLGAFRDIPPVETRSMRAAGMGTAPGVKLEQVAVVQPNVRPGGRAAAEAQYAVSSPGGTMQVRETRMVQFNGTTLTRREKVFTRQSGRVRSESQFAVPQDAAEGIYTVTTIVAPVVTTRGVTPEEKAETIFIVKAGGSSPPPPPGPVPNPVTPPVQPGGQQGDGRLEVRVWADKDRYRIGEKVTFFFETNKDAYVTLVNKGTSGKVTVLFPNPYARGFQVKGKTTYRIPAQGDPYVMTVSDPPGQEMVIATATVSPMGFSADAAVPDANKLTRDINVHAQGSPPEERAQTELVLEAVE